MFAKPRPKKDGLGAPPPRRKRKADYAIEEINFDDSARADYLTGFHKRKVLRQKQAQEIATEKARQEKIEFRRQLREQRQRDVEEHVQQVNEALRVARLATGEVDEEGEKGSNAEEDEEWGGIEDEEKVPEFVDHEEEYIDEDRFTTVTVEAVDIDRDGMHRLTGKGSDDEEDNDKGGEAEGDGGAEDDASKDQETDEKKKEWPKKKKKKFRYENKLERQVSRMKQKRKR